MFGVDPKMVDKVLLRAAEIVEVGWCQGSYTRASSLTEAQVGVDEFCLMGALAKATMEVTGVSERESLSSEEAAEATYRMARRVGASLTAWNDRKCQTREQVVSLLREVANA